jgi:hypothetical protein
VPLTCSSQIFCSPVLAAAIFVDMPGRDHFAGLHDDLFAGILTTDHHFWEGSYYFPLDREAEVGSSNLFAYQDPARSSGRTTIACSCCDILEMQEDRSEWSVLFRVDLSRVKELYPSIEWPTWDTRRPQHKIIDYLALSPTYVIRGAGKTGQHALIFSIPGKIMSYNMKNNEISVVKEIGSPYQLELFWYSFYTYHPSLFAL